MTRQGEPRVAARLPDDAAKHQAIIDYLQSRGLDTAKRFAEKDDDDLNAAVISGEFERVIFTDLNDLLVTIWKGETKWDRWRSAGTEVILVNPPAADWLSVVDTTYASLNAWRSVRRRRQTIAAVVLSIVALAAMAVLFYLLPPPR